MQINAQKWPRQPISILLGESQKGHYSGGCFGCFIFNFFSSIINNPFTRASTTHRVFAVSLVFASCLLPRQTLISTVQASHPVTASSAGAFVDSIGVNTHLGYLNTPYGTAYPAIKVALVGAGIRHIREGGTAPIVVSELQDLATSGIKTTYLLSPDQGVAPTTAYWENSPGYLLSYFLKSVVGAGVVDSVEMPNELDGFYRNFRWHPTDSVSLSNDPSSPVYWAKYGVSITKDSWAVLKSDPTLAAVKLIGPALGSKANGFSSGSLYGVVDWGSFHPYPYGGNSWSYPLPYDSTDKYFWHSTQPTVNIDQYPYAFQMSQGAFSRGAGTAPMAATETGYFTGTSEQSVTELAQAKYVPRLIAEYFRHSIPRTILYELVDEFSNPADKESNFGLLHQDLTPKPAYTALSSLLNLLKDPVSTAFAPGSLAYSIAAQPTGPYTKTQYVHDLLLEKQDGSFYLLLWHEISDSSFTDAVGSSLKSTARDIQPLSLMATVTLPPNVQSAILYIYDASWNLEPQPLTILNGQVTLAASDTISVLKFVTTPLP